MYICTREPGGTHVGDLIIENFLREEKLSYKAISPMTELLLVLAGRYQNIKDTIFPGIYFGYLVICDRFIDTTFSYQGAGRGISSNIIKKISQMTKCFIIPDKTILLNISVIISRIRIEKRGNFDRIEREDTKFFKKVNRNYLMLAKKHQNRFVVITASRSVRTMQAIVLQVLNSLFKYHDE